MNVQSETANFMEGCMRAHIDGNFFHLAQKISSFLHTILTVGDIMVSTQDSHTNLLMPMVHKLLHTSSLSMTQCFSANHFNLFGEITRPSMVLMDVLDNSHQTQNRKKMCSGPRQCLLELPRPPKHVYRAMFGFMNGQL